MLCSKDFCYSQFDFRLPHVDFLCGIVGWWGAICAALTNKCDRTMHIKWEEATLTHHITVGSCIKIPVSIKTVYSKIHSILVQLTINTLHLYMFLHVSCLFCQWYTQMFFNFCMNNARTCTHWLTEPSVVTDSRLKIHSTNTMPQSDYGLFTKDTLIRLSFFWYCN
jgi:hypothetical protein